VEFSDKSLLAKARARPDLVRQVFEKAQREGVLAASDAVRTRLDQLMPLGYSSAGTVIDVGEGVGGYAIGDRVACGGGGYAVHAEIVTVPQNLSVKLPPDLGLEDAAFTTLGAIALQGIRLAGIELGALVGVIGLGLLGQLTVQMLKAAGCTVIGLDVQVARADLANRVRSADGVAIGADATSVDPGEFALLCQQMSAGHGVDAVVITADTPSNQPVELAGAVARKKGIVVAVGAVGMNIPRKVYYEKELDFRISSSYGPGRYDVSYEEKGRDYPYPYVRWTENRNMRAFVQWLAEGKVNVQPLITHRFPFDEAPQAYDLITGKTGESFLGVLLAYSGSPDLARRVPTTDHEPSTISTGVAADGRAPRTAPDESNGASSGAAGSPPRHPLPVAKITLGVIGAGNYANATLLPALRGIPGLELRAIASQRGLTARSAADRFHFAYSTTDPQDVVGDPGINTLAVLTRHASHAALVLAGLSEGKHVFVEKPLCITDEELDEITKRWRKAAGSATRPGAAQDHPREDGNAQPGQAGVARSMAPYVMVGFNRRFAPFVVALKQRLARIPEPLLLHYRVNAGYIPPQHWTQDPAVGGGRLIGEGCHFIDLLIHLAGSRVQRVTARALPDEDRYCQDNFTVLLEFANGALATLTYAANGNRGFGKECLEVFGGDLAARLDDFRALNVCQGKERLVQSARLRQDKGHRAEWQALAAYLTGRGPLPIPVEDALHSTAVTLAARRSLQAGQAVDLIDGP
jgi:predicted dehydrogenase/threonine dehydrogenase-like Zn-dependent dehydrogenase